MAKILGIDLGTTYFQSPTQFYMNQANILSVITSKWQTPPANCNILCEFTLFANSFIGVGSSIKPVTQSFKLNIQL